jgi:hypothetical protein
MAVTGNQFSRIFYRHGGYYGYIAGFVPGRHGNVWSGNHWSGRAAAGLTGAVAWP